MNDIGNTSVVLLRIRRNVLVAIAIIGFSTNAVIGQESVFSISLGADVLAPLGKFKSEVLTGYGGSAKFNFVLSKQLTLVASAGLLSFERKSDSLSSFRGSPVRLGLKFYVVRSFSAQVYCSAEAGVFISTDKQNKSNGFSAAPITGFELPVGTKTCLDLSFRYDYVDLPGRKRASLGVRAAANFQL